MNTDHHNQDAGAAGRELLALVEASGKGWRRRVRQGMTLFLEGDSIEWVYFVLDGKVKTHSLSQEGKARTFGIWGRGNVLGLTGYILGQNHLFLASAWEDTELLMISPQDLTRLLRSDPDLSLAVMRYLARFVEVFQREVEALSFLDVQGRLRRSLEELAVQHGREALAGREIDLEITHEELAELASTNRSTVTVFLNELKRQGYLWMDGRKMVVMPPEQIRILENLVEAVAHGDAAAAGQWATRALDCQIDPAVVRAKLEQASPLDHSPERADHQDIAAARDAALSALEAPGTG
jgi:CRP-like cAMP-binding protein